ncbi:HsdM family class I SAM-dependent methyltransferase [Streptococcus infantarius]|uniref:HsdM family class I SAM-dependent methyltransferase n=1 Tax=Streptococcus infantarius TaxID=102684 RepID=UPI0022E084E0|nr:Eco57I restriction-modification methylase domain-containing protein [Streptococcus infantarius]
MISEMLQAALITILSYIDGNYTDSDKVIIERELYKIVGTENIFEFELKDSFDYEQTQSILAKINEKESIRKHKGVYYTPKDVVDFIVVNSYKNVLNALTETNISELNLSDLPFANICLDKIVFDPTCGAGEFLLSALEKKFDLLDLENRNISPKLIHKVVSTIKGNDINLESIIITKIRLLLLVLARYGAECVNNISIVFENSFYCYDYITDYINIKESFDIIIGNPPYVEQSKSGLKPKISYGNIYANVLDNAAMQLKEGGVIGFIIPLSYISTPRMKKIRERLLNKLPEQYILNYSDRPDSLFISVHQKLSILFGKNNQKIERIYTGGYTYWYKEERDKLFSSVKVFENSFKNELFIPKIGTKFDALVYDKIQKQDVLLSDYFKNGENKLYLNMRAAFWIKSFLNEHNGSEYKVISSDNKEHIYYLMCLFNSSLYWWYWICVSDCWHITKKELNKFKVPKNVDFNKLKELALNLESKLESTKQYVGTRQTEYEYKHRLCLAEIHEIDDYINSVFGLSDNESNYIKNFRLRYRVGGGIKK